MRAFARNLTSALAATTAMLLLTAPLAVAQQVPDQQAQERALSLREAMSLAERANPQYRRALNDIRIAGAAGREALGAYLPTLSASVNFSGNASRRLTTFDEFGNAVRLDEPISFRASQSYQSIAVSYLLFDGGAREREFSAARVETYSAEARLDQAAFELHAEVARRYYQVLGATARVALEDRLLASAREQLEATERLFRVAGASRIDVLGMQMEVASREAELERARGDARKAELLLAELAGLDAGQPIHLSDTLPSAVPRALPDAEPLVAQALERHPRIVALEATARAANSRASAARGSRWPRVQANASLSRSFADRDYSGLFEMDPPDRYFSFSLSTSIPLLDGFQTSARVTRADAAADNAHYELQAARLTLARELRSSMIDVQDAERRLAIARRNTELSRERVELALQQYRLGAMRFPELQLVLDASARAERSEIDAQVALASALATLDEKSGGLLEWPGR